MGKVAKIENFVNKLNEFDGTLKSMDKWMKEADTQLHDIKNNSDKMTQKIEFHTLWSCRKMLLPRLKSSRPMWLLSLSFSHKEIRFLKMLRITRSNSRASKISWQISRRES